LLPYGGDNWCWACVEYFHFVYHNITSYHNTTILKKVQVHFIPIWLFLKNFLRCFLKNVYLYLEGVRNMWYKERKSNFYITVTLVIMLAGIWRLKDVYGVDLNGCRT
jgi:hypothetical protein